MGLLSSFVGGAKSAAASVNPTSLLGGGGANLSGLATNMLGGGGANLSGLATNMLGGAVKNGLQNLLGMDPEVPCPSHGKTGGNSIGADNDPCGQHDDSLKSALLGMGLSAAGPAIAGIGDALGGALDTGIGALTSAVEGGMESLAGGFVDAVMDDPDTMLENAIKDKLREIRMTREAAEASAS